MNKLCFLVLIASLSIYPSLAKPAKPCFTWATCSDGKYGDGLASFYNDYEEGDNLVIQTNGIPGIEYHKDREKVNPNAACEHPVQIKLPLNPTKLTKA